MSEWWSYRLSDFLLFSPRTYYRLFEIYNESVWPLQIAAALIGLAVLALLLWRPPFAGRAAALLLAICWAWIAYAYLHTRYATINWAATYFAYGFALQAALLLLVGTASPRLTFSKAPAWSAKAGTALFALALLAYPLIGPLLGRSWSQLELFGLAPDPTVLATLGVVLAADRIRWLLLPIPVLWCAVSGLTLWAMEAPEALLMPAAGVLTVLVGLGRTLSDWRQGKRG